MLRSLLWKEWREQRAVAISGAVVAVLMPGLIFAGLGLAGATQRVQEVLTLLPIANWVLLWPLAALATAASAVTGELGDARLGFLLSRPVSRTRLLAVKLAIAAVVALAIIAAGQGVATAASWMLAEPVVEGVTPPPIDLDSMDRLLVEGVVAFAALCFAFAAFLSLMLSRAIQVVPLAGILASAFFGANLLLWWRLDYLPVIDSRTTAWTVVLAAGLLAATFVSFRRGELLRGKAHVLRTLGMGAAVLILWLGATGAMAVYEMRPPGDDVLFDGLAVSPDGVTVATTVAREDRAASLTVGFIGASGDMRLVGQRLSRNPAFSPDGRYLAYVVMSNRLGLRSNTLSLYVHDIQTGEERALASLTGEYFANAAVPVFSTDSRFVAVDFPWDTVVADVEADLPPRTWQRRPGWGNAPSCRLLGWDAHRAEVLRTCRVSGALEWFDPVTGERVRETKSPTVARERFYGLGWRPDRIVALRVHESYDLHKDERRDRTGVLDLASLETTWLIEGEFYGSVAIATVAAPAGGREALVAFSRHTDDADETELVIRRESAGETVLARHPLSDWGATLALSPAGRWLFSRVQTGAMIERRVVSNTVYDLATGDVMDAGGVDATAWYGSEWLGPDRLVYLDAMISTPVAERTAVLDVQQGWSREIRILDAATGERTILWPPQ